MTNGGYQLLCVHRSELKEVWKSHLLSFLLPDVYLMRKWYGVLCHELGLYYVVRRRDSFRYRTSQLTHDRFLISVSHCGELRSRYVIHMNEQGRMHCRTEYDQSIYHYHAPWAFYHNGWYLRIHDRQVCWYSSTLLSWHWCGFARVDKERTSPCMIQRFVNHLIIHP
jgi:hypothetical protein